MEKNEKLQHTAIFPFFLFANFQNLDFPHVSRPTKLGLDFLSLI